MKHRIFKRYRTRKKGGQRYLVGRRLKKNYGGGPLFGKRLEEKGITIQGTPKEQKIIRRLFERNPELIEKGITVIPEDLPIVGRIPLGVYYHEPKHIELDKEFLLTGKKTVPIHQHGRTDPLYMDMRRRQLRRAGFSPDKINEESFIVASYDFNKSTPERTLKHEIAHARQHELPSSIPLRIKLEKEARIAMSLPPQRKRKIPQEEIGKTFREVFKDGA